jgi:hypothetical protein
VTASSATLPAASWRAAFRLRPPDYGGTDGLGLRRSLSEGGRAVIFAENLVDRVLLPYPHQHVVFTIPKRIRPYFKFARTLNRHLYSSAWSAWHELVREQHPGGKIGALMALHTAGDLLPFHPHIHSLALAGAVLPDNSFAPTKIDPLRLQDIFAEKLLAALVDEGLISDDTVQNMPPSPRLRRPGIGAGPT